MKVDTTATPPDERPGKKKAKPVEPDYSGVEAAVREAAAKAGSKEADPPPRGRRRAAGQKRDAPTTAQLEEVLAEAMVMPAIPMKMIFHCDFCMQHFLTTGPEAAHELAALSETNPALRRVLEQLHQWWAALMFGGVLGQYLAKPIIHHAAPEQVLEAVGPVMKIPPRPKPPGHPHDAESPPSAPSANGTGAKRAEPGAEPAKPAEA